jgi:hypothetical protein
MDEDLIGKELQTECKSSHLALIYLNIYYFKNFLYLLLF